MNYTITSADRQLAFSRWLELSVKLLILNDDNSVFDDLTGIANAGTLNIDSSSSVRRALQSHRPLLIIISAHG